jgi:hypothetical protein
MPEFVVGCIAVALVCFVVLQFLPPSTPLTPAQAVARRYGPANPQMVCPHCQTKGTVHTSRATQKAGISGGKATVALLTGGTSLLATGLSRKVDLTACYCHTCDANWTF